MAETKMPSKDPVAEQLRMQYPSNSIVAKQDEKPEKATMKAVASGQVTSSKEPIGKRLLRLFIAEDIRDVKRYILEDVLIPGIKTTVLSSLDRLFFARGGPYSPYYRPYDYTKGAKQSRYSYGGGTPPRREQTQPPRAPSGLKYITYAARQEADAVLIEMTGRIEEYGEVTVRDYYEASGVDSEFTDEKWGWTNLRGAHVYPVRGGYAIELPPVQVLES